MFTQDLFPQQKPANAWLVFDGEGGAREQRSPPPSLLASTEKSLNPRIRAGMSEVRGMEDRQAKKGGHVGRGNVFLTRRGNAGGLEMGASFREKLGWC